MMNAPSPVNRHLAQRLGFTAITLMAVATVLPIVAVVIYILIQGLPAISLEFLTGFPHDGMRAGGILPAIIGTIYLTIGTAIFSVPLGIAAAIYLSEYASRYTADAHDPHRDHQSGRHSLGGLWIVRSWVSLSSS